MSLTVASGGGPRVPGALPSGTGGGWDGPGPYHPRVTLSITRSAHAKVNLVLSVGGAQPPKGYHPIASWMAPVTLADELSVTRLEEGAASEHRIEWAEDAPRPSAIDWPPEKDLAVRAHRVMEEHAGRALPVRMVLRKRIPVGAGLGGGSSDAAAMLLALNELFELHLAEGALAMLAGLLGSDVSYFVDAAASGLPDAPHAPRPAIVTGLGERVERVDRVPAQLVLIFPPFGCPTGEVYRAFDAPGGARPGLREAQVRQVVSAAVAAHRVNPAALFNDLAAPAQAVAPKLAEVRVAAREVLRTPVHITGSGSAMFAVLDGAGPQEAQRRAEEVMRVVRGVAAVAAGLC